MQYIVTRASDYMGFKKPCENAKLKAVPQVEYCDIKVMENPEKYSKWLKTGKNHRTVDGLLAKSMGKEDVWVISITTLKQMSDFCDQYGEIIFGEYINNHDLKQIIIYDDCVEKRR